MFQPSAAFEYVVQSGSAPRVVLALHGTGGDENDLVPLAQAIDPEASVLSPRGRVNEGGALRFFRRFAEGKFDLEDMRLQTEDLAKFVQEALEAHGWAGQPVTALGFSNGANMASSLMLRNPGLLAGGMLLRAQVPFEPDPVPQLGGTRVFIASGKTDPLIPIPDATRLAEIYRAAGAEVEHLWLEAGHHLTREEITAAQQWVKKS